MAEREGLITAVQQLEKIFSILRKSLRAWRSVLGPEKNDVKLAKLLSQGMTVFLE
jgi:hypothetical protein